MSNNNTKLCVFCKTSLTNNNRSKEHVIPQWLLSYLDIRKEKIQPTHFTSTGVTRNTRKMTLNRLIEGNVCKSCNGGWMSQLEQEAMPIIKSLIKCDNVVVSLNRIERQIVGRWVAKTAFTLNSSANYIKNVPSEHYDFIMLNKDILPKNVYTYAQQHHGNKTFNWMQSATWSIQNDSDVAIKYKTELEMHSYKVSFQFGKLMLLIVFLSNDSVYPVLWRGIHVPLLPLKGKCKYYVSKEFDWDDSVSALRQFHFGLHAFIHEDVNIIK